MSATPASAQYLTFLLAGEEYGIAILKVQEIKGWSNATRIPYAPDYVLGVINLRGAVVPVLDLRRRFKLEPVPFGPTTVIIVVRANVAGGARTVGVVVDAVSEVYDIAATQLQEPPDLCGQVDSMFITALATVDEKMLLLLDADRLIGSSILESAAQDAAA
jgi:purine-binding chemotaxis protein CheW